jgi:hypothetical protein
MERRQACRDKGNHIRRKVGVRINFKKESFYGGNGLISKEVNTMPRGDGTGPRGKGPGTGRGLGNCSDKRQEVQELDQEPGFFQRLGRGLGLGRTTGQGRGLGTGQGQGQGRRRSR